MLTTALFIPPVPVTWSHCIFFPKTFHLCISQCRNQSSEESEGAPAELPRDKNQTKPSPSATLKPHQVQTNILKYTQRLEVLGASCTVGLFMAAARHRTLSLTTLMAWSSSIIFSWSTSSPSHHVLFLKSLDETMKIRLFLHHSDSTQASAMFWKDTLVLVGPPFLPTKPCFCSISPMPRSTASPTVLLHASRCSDIHLRCGITLQIFKKTTASRSLLPPTCFEKPCSYLHSPTFAQSWHQHLLG